MPVAYGGGIRSADKIGRLLRSCVEKVVLSTAAFETPSLIAEAAGRYGNQAIVVCLPVKRSLLGSPRVNLRSASRDTGLAPAAAA
ncbi:HisA/HisF-related TIM barrel protein, partial [Acinetobacter baumannii]